jgi:hypothetical protein
MSEISFTLLTIQIRTTQSKVRINKLWMTQTPRACEQLHQRVRVGSCNV